ncbi:hypothetical protein, partial [Methylosoma difficile]
CLHDIGAFFMPGNLPGFRFQSAIGKAAFRTRQKRPPDPKRRGWAASLTGWLNLPFSGWLFQFHFNP